MSTSGTAEENASSRFALRLRPIMGAIAGAFLIIGIALPVLPLYVHAELGFGTAVIGLVTGLQFAGSVVSRIWAGSHADRRGARSAMVLGLLGAAAAGLLYLMSLLAIRAPVMSLTLLLLGRGMLGVAESFIVTGGVSWGLGLAGRQSAGRVIAWVGMAMFSSMAIGSPVGMPLYFLGGFAAIAAITTSVPLVVFSLLRLLPPPVPVSTAKSADLRSVLGGVWLPGLGAALASVGYGATLAFGALLFAERGWAPVWLAFSCFGAALILARVFLGDLPDKVGGARVALVFAVIESLGLGLLWLANGTISAAIGAGLTGLGYSLVYPGFGVEAIRRVPPENRGVAMGAYTVCLNIALGLSSVALGMVGAKYVTQDVFLVSAATALFSGLVAGWLVIGVSPGATLLKKKAVS